MSNYRNKGFFIICSNTSGSSLQKDSLAGIGCCYEFLAQWDTTSGGSDSRGLGFHTNA